MAELIKKDGFDRAAGLIRAIKNDGINLHLIFNPVRSEVFARNCPANLDCRNDSKLPKFQEIRERWQEYQFSFANMLDYMPVEPNPEIIKKWYIPSDGHFSDNGGTVYAGAVYKYLRSVLLPVDR